ncbi:MAG: PEP-CTERM sorting domain-containing protein [Telluria sp.]
MKTILASLIIAISAASAVHAAPITGTGVPVLPGATTTVDFEGQPLGSFASLTLGGVNFSGTDGDLRTESTYGGDYNTTGTVYLDNMAGQTGGFHFGFAAPVSAFAFNFGAADVNWTLTAFDSAGVALESLILSPTHAGNDGNYFGIANAGIAYATLTGMGDWVLLDNFVVAAEEANDVPEPGSLALLGLGLAGIGALRKRSRG